MSEKKKKVYNQISEEFKAIIRPIEMEILCLFEETKILTPNEILERTNISQISVYVKLLKLARRGLLSLEKNKSFYNTYTVTRKGLKTIRLIKELMKLTSIKSD